MRAVGIVIVVVGLGMWLLAFEALNSQAVPGRGPAGTEITSRPPAPTSTPVDAVATSPSTGTEPVAEQSPTPEPTATAAPDTDTYTVQSGDTMARIAARHGVSLERLLAANPEIDDPTRIDVGQQINIPPPP